MALSESLFCSAVRAPLASPFKILAKAKFKVALPPMLEMARP